MSKNSKKFITTSFWMGAAPKSWSKSKYTTDIAQKLDQLASGHVSNIKKLDWMVKYSRHSVIGHVQ